MTTIRHRRDPGARGRPDDGSGPARPLVRLHGLPTPAGPVDLEVEPGEAVRVVGPNGGGKTSLLRALAGLDGPVRPASVAVDGVDPRDLPAARRREQSELLHQEPGDGLVGLTVAGEFRMRGRGPVPAGLDPGRDVATLSTGEARRVTLALARAADVPLLLLDEPAEGLDAAGRDALRRLVRAARRRGAVVFVDPDGALAAEATRTVVLGGVERAAPPGFEPRSAGPEGRLTAPVRRVTLGDRTLHLPGLDLGPGLHALVGRNGGGKTTLLRRLAGLGPAPACDPGTPYLPPRARDLLTDDAVAACLDGAEPAVVDALVPARLRHRHPWTLSGGEAQRVALASVLGRPGSVFLLDEPDAHLDGDGYGALCRVLRRRVDAGCVVVAATHDDGLRAAATSVVEVDA